MKYDNEERRFSCTACGQCCNRGPEMELGEAAALASDFVTSLVFKVHSIPLNDRSERLRQWWINSGSRIPPRAALDESRRQLALYSSRRRSERAKQRDTYLIISAIVDDYEFGKCPALHENLCSIYDRRPLTCQSVPLHYSRPQSTLNKYIDRFVETVGYECDIDQGETVIIGGRIVSQKYKESRDLAHKRAMADRPWKQKMLSLMDNPNLARRAGLPSYDDVLTNSNQGQATTLPMIVAWRVAEYYGIISIDELKGICQSQLDLIRSISLKTPNDSNLRQIVSLYEAGAMGKGRLADI